LDVEDLLLPQLRPFTHLISHNLIGIKPKYILMQIPAPEFSFCPSPQNNSLSQQETATGLRLRRKMFLVINKKLLTHASIFPISFALSLEPFGLPFQIDCLTISSCDSGSMKKEKLFCIEELGERL